MELKKKIFVENRLCHIYGEDHEYHANEWSFYQDNFRPICETSRIFQNLISEFGGKKDLNSHTLKHIESLGYKVVKLRSWTGQRFGGVQTYVYRDFLIRNDDELGFIIFEPHPATWIVTGKRSKFDYFISK